MRLTILDVRFTIMAAACLLLMSCGSTRIIHIPVESVRTQYIDRWQRDSIFHRDSIFLNRWHDGDTVFVTREVFQLRYIDRIVRDSIMIIDSVQVAFPVEVIHEVNRLTRWQRWRLNTLNVIVALGGAWAAWQLGKKRWRFRL